MMKKLVISFLIFFLLSNILPTFALSDNSIKIDAKAYLLMDPITGRILLGKNINEKKAMASTTKIMTAIVALEEGELGSKVQVSKRAAGIGGSSFRLLPKEEMSLENMLYGLLLSSGNDAAIAIAEHISGSVEGFVELMNKKALELGAINTHYINPHGLDAPGHYSTAEDLAIIARYALNIPKFREIVNTKEKTIEEGNFTRKIVNTNKLLWSFEGADGIKTGYTGKAGRCLVASAVKNDIQLLSVVLGTRDHFKNSKVLLDYGFSNYKLVKAIEKSKCSNVVNVENGKEDKVFIQAKDDIFIPKAENEEMRLEMVIPNKIKAPILKNQQIGVAYVYINDKAVYSTPMIAKKDIKEKTLSDVIYDIFRIWLDINKHLSSLSNLSNKSALKLNPRITLDRG